MPDGSVNESRIKRQIVQRLSLRHPQETSLDILDDVLLRITLGKDADLSAAFAAIKTPTLQWSILNGSFRLCALRLPQVSARHASWGRSSPICS